MGKIYSHEPGGIEAVTDGAGYTGTFKVDDAADLHEVARILDAYTIEQIMVAGVPRYDEMYGYVHTGVPRGGMDLTRYADITRTKKDLQEATYAIATLDSDFDHAPWWTQHIQTPEEYRSFLLSVVPELSHVGLLIRPSGSNGVCLPDGTPYKKTKNFHASFVCNGEERVEIIERLHSLFVHRGYGWLMIGQSGALLERSPVDLALRTVNQPIFAARPRVVEPVINRRPDPLVTDGEMLLLSVLPEAEPVASVFDAMRQDSEVLLRQAQVKQAYIKQKTREKLKLQPVVDRKAMRAELKRQKVQAIARDKSTQGGSLPPYFILHLKAFGAVSVEEVLKNPRRYHEAKTCDPIEPEYRNWAQTGILFLDGSVPRLVSLAHGQSRSYILESFLCEDRPFDVDSLVASVTQRNSGGSTPPPSVDKDTVSLADGSARLRSLVRSFFTNPRNTAADVTPGTGKTREAAETAAWAEFQVGRFGRYTLFLAPMVRNLLEAFEAYKQAGGRDGYVWLGRSQPDPDNDEEMMCTNPEHMARALAYGTNERSICSGCPLRGKKQCGYDRQVHHVATTQPATIFATHAFLFYPIPGWQPHRVIIDESIANGGVDLEVSTDATGIFHLQHVAKELRKQAVQNALDKERDKLPNFSNLEEVLESRHRYLVLEGMLNDERIVWMNGRAYLPKKLVYKHEGIPTLVLDGTFRRKLTELVIGPLDEVVRIQVKRNIKVVQVIGSFGTEWMTKSANLQNFVRAIEHLYQFISMPLKLRKHMEKTRDPKYSHPGGSKGLNNWATAKNGLLLGANCKSG